MNSHVNVTTILERAQREYQEEIQADWDAWLKSDQRSRAIRAYKINHNAFHRRFIRNTKSVLSEFLLFLGNKLISLSHRLTP